MKLLELANDTVWLSRMTNVIHQYWQKKNGARKAAHLGQCAMPLGCGENRARSGAKPEAKANAV